MEYLDLRQEDDTRLVCPKCGLTRTLSAAGLQMLREQGTYPLKCAKCRVDLVER